MYVAGLDLWLKVGQDEYPLWQDVAGFKVFVHNQSETIFAESVSYAVKPGFQTSIGIKWVTLIRST